MSGWIACEDCGTRMCGDICPNCQEELYIYERQGVDAPAEEFMEQVAEQRREIARKGSK